MDYRPARRRPNPAQDALRSTECAEARTLLGQFVEGEMNRAADRRFRHHLTSCPDCREAYRETLASAARLGRALREAREEEARLRRRSEHRKSALEAGTLASRGRGFRLRLVLIPAFIVLLWTQLEGVRPPGLEVSLPPDAPQTGVLVAGAPLVPGGDARLEAGQWCSTSAEARAYIEAKHGEIQLEPGTRLLVEDARLGHLRLQTGALELEGTWRVLLQLGAVRLEAGQARLVLENGALRIVCQAGRVEFENSRGMQEIQAGEQALVGLDDLVLQSL